MKTISYFNLKIALLILSLVTVLSCEKDETQDDESNNTTVIDFDGNEYKTVEIGNQVWLGENLKSSRYPDGSVITKGIYDYENNTANSEIYGKLYTWETSMNGQTIEKSQGVCPSGWHIPSKSEWEELIDYLGGVTSAGGKLKEEGKTYWTSTDSTVTNSSGFTALPAGFMFYNFYMNLGVETGFWTSTEYNNDEAYYKGLWNSHSRVLGPSTYKATMGLSVRCIKDE